MKHKNIKMRKFVIVLFATVLVSLVSAQGSYAPNADTPGTTAMHKDSSAFVAWATGATVERGWQNILDTTLGKTTVGSISSALGQAGDGSVISLGDGGEIILTFDYPVFNGVGVDFAVFENGFDNNFLELAFVEVSSNGVDFVRFPSHSETQTTTQVGGFGTLDATMIHNLAGKYKSKYGTPFDLEDLIDSSLVDINNITHIKIVDVVGSINDSVARYDSYGNKVNDPFPTPFPSGGFDLDGVGVVHQFVGVEETIGNKIQFYPNPTVDYLNIIAKEEVWLDVFNNRGQRLKHLLIKQTQQLDFRNFAEGIYYVRVVDVKNNQLIQVERVVKLK